MQEDLYFGILTLALATAGYILAGRLHSSRKTTGALLLIVLSGLILRVYTASDQYLHTWDERYHALVAKNMIDHPLKPTLYEDPVLRYDMENWTGNHVWLHKQPFSLWTLALSLFLFGINEFALRLPSIILTTLGTGITYILGRDLFNRRVGIIAAFLYSIHGLIIEMTAGRVATDHVDIFFLFFIELAIWLAWRHSRSKSRYDLILCGVTIGIAVLCKWLPALIVLPVWVLFAMDSGKFNIREIIAGLVVLFLTAAIIFLPWQFYIHEVFPAEAQWESEFNRRHLTEVIEEREGSFLYHFNKIRMLFGELIYLPLIWLLWKSWKRKKNFRRLALVTWIFVPLVFFSFAATKMQGYTLFTAPAMFMLTGLFYHYLMVYRKRFRYQWIVSNFLFIFMLLPVRYSLERIKPLRNSDRSPEWAMNLKKLDIHREKVVLLNTAHPIEAMFYNDCSAYSYIPEPAVIEDLEARGYEVIILPDEFNGPEKSKE